MAERTASEQSIFLAAVDRPTGPERAAYLEEVCAGNAALRGEVEALLAAHERLPIGEGPDTAADVHRPPTFTSPGTVIGRYKVLEPIGEGGYGTVFMAEQTTPVQRRVALKIIKAGMDTRQVIARFEAERQALALMDHPNIARVFDAGVTDAGRPYFVMELVKGQPITKYCDEHKLTPRQRLELFVQVCHAVQHAHQKGIIHRDLKPTNVLVARYDGKPVPKVIDFGVAKATGQRLTDATMFTGFGDVIGTPQYMSPEQAELNQLDVDTRSDVYSLGVLLYELLTGTTPLEGKRVREAALLEVLRVIREEEPPRPSTRLTAAATAAELPGIAAQRGLEPRSLSGIVRGELDWIVMKALEKDRGRRYETASGFAADVERYLAGEPVQAVPSSPGYRLRKFARRNKVPVVSGALILLAMAAGTVATSRGLVRAERARKEAVAARSSEAVRAEGERTAKQEAQARETEIAAVLEFVQKRVFAAARPERQAGGLGRDVTLRRAVEAALTSVEQDFADRPLIEARLRRTLGDSFWYLGETGIAVTQHERARTLYLRHVGPDHVDALGCTRSLANSYEHAGRQEEALQLRQEALARARAGLGSDHAETIRARTGLANSYFDLRRHTEALALREEALTLARAKFGADDPETLGTMHNLANSYEAVGRGAEAIKLREEVLPLRKARFGADHPDTIASMANLAFSYDAAGRHADALGLREQTLALSKAKLGPDHRETLVAMLNLAVSYTNAGRGDEALRLEEEALALLRPKHGADHPHTLRLMGNLAMSYHAAGRHADALKLRQEVLALTDAKLGPDDPATLRAMGYVAQSLVGCERGAEAVPLIDECVRRAGRQAGADRPLVAALLDLRLRHFQNGRDASGCRATAEMLEQCNWGDADGLYDAARFSAVTAAVLRAMGQADGASKPAAPEADRAMDWLGKAVAAGYRDVARVKRDKDLDALRGREDFQRLITGLAAGQAAEP